MTARHRPRAHGRRRPAAEDPSGACFRDQGSAGVGTELLHEMPAVGADCVDRKCEVVRDLRVGGAGGDRDEHLELSGGQPDRGMRRRMARREGPNDGAGSCRVRRSPFTIRYQRAGSEPAGVVKDCGDRGAGEDCSGVAGEQRGERDVAESEPVRPGAEHHRPHDALRRAQRRGEQMRRAVLEVRNPARVLAEQLTHRGLRFPPRLCPERFMTVQQRHEARLVSGNLERRAEVLMAQHPQGCEAVRFRNPDLQRYSMRADGLCKQGDQQAGHISRILERRGVVEQIDHPGGEVASSCRHGVAPPIAERGNGWP